jgi:hypothetical protein
MFRISSDDFLSSAEDVCLLSGDEERILVSFTKRLIEIAAVAGARGAGTSAIEAFNKISLPAIAIDRRGFVVGVNAAAYAVFDNDVNIKDKRLFVRDPKARAHLKASLDELTDPVKSLLALPVIVQRPDESLVILRIWPFEGATHSPEQELQALVTLCMLGSNPVPPEAILAKTFRLIANPRRMDS